MKKILLLGKMNVVFKDLYDFLYTKCDYINIQVCSDHIETAENVLKIVEPDLIIISLMRLDKVCLKLFATIRSKHGDTPVLCIGTELEQEPFEAFLETDQYSIMPRPCTNRKIWYYIKGMLSIKEKADVEEEETASNGAKEIAKANTGANKPRVVQSSDDDLLEIKFDSGSDNWLDNQSEKPELDITLPPVNANNAASNKIRVLLVDDNAVQLRALRTAMIKDYDILLAVSGEEALDIMLNQKPDIVFLDYNMPGYNGKQVLEMARQTETINKIPIVFLAGVQDKEIIMGLIKLKPNGYLVKPPNIDQINDTIRKLVG